MAVRRPLTTLACANCQRWLLGSFIAAIGGGAPSQGAHRPRQPRAFSRLASQRRDAHDEAQIEEHPLNAINDEVSRSTDPPKSPSAPTQTPTQTHLPWYLQIQAQNRTQTEDSPHTTAQALPPLPSNPPPLLSPLLSQISTTLGLTNLTLLDLRHLTDPPPALGANLLMLLTTARSERHLHASADRLCRWLRSEYKLAPYADGLLGRGELKILMRRRAKRGRILGAVSGVKGTGGADLGESDGGAGDGVRTGWVCVNVGRVEGGGVAALEEERPDFVGFGRRSGGTTLVVQMFTEEKREEIGLEALWGEVLARAERERKRGLPGDQEDKSVEEGALSEMESSHSTSSPSLASESKQAGLHFESTPPVSNQASAQQLRGYHTSARRSRTTARADVGLREESLQTSSSSAPIYTTSPPDQSIEILTKQLTHLQSLPRASALNKLGPNLLTATQKQDLLLVSRNANIKTPSTTSLTQPTNSSPKSSPSSSVQSSADGSSDSTFLTNFYNTIPPFPTAAHWHAHIALLVLARQLGHPDAHSPVLLAQLSNMQIAGLIPEERTFLLVLKAILSPLGTGGREWGSDGAGKVMGEWKTQAVLSLLEEMENCGYDVLDPARGVFGMIAKAAGAVGHATASADTAADSDALTFSSIVPALHTARLRRLLTSSDRHLFWRTWRSYPQRFLPRSAPMYTVLFSALSRGELGTGGEAREVLRDGLEAMEAEVPEVDVEGDRLLAGAVRSAIEFVDGGVVGREWRAWYMRCGRVVGAEG